jgi:hypothetical protein
MFAIGLAELLLGFRWSGDAPARIKRSKKGTMWILKIPGYEKAY